MKCEHRPPDGWPGGPCQKEARFDVLYHIATQELPRGMRVCLIHLAELRQLNERGALKAFDAQEMERAPR